MNLRSKTDVDHKRTAGLFVQNFLEVKPTVSQAAAPRKAMDPPQEPGSKRRNKWTLGSLFRRKKTSKGAESSGSSSEVEEKPRSFLGRRRSARKRSDLNGTRSKETLKLNPPWSGSANSLGSSEGFGSHGSLTRKDRRELVKARVEATRRNSSSEDDSSNLTRFKSDDSLANKRSRAARTERYMKRISKDEESLSHHSLSKSDVEIHPPPSSQNWAATVVYRENSPYVTRPVSATPSPVVSPRVQHRIFPTYPPQMSPHLPRAARRSYCEPPRSDILPAGFRCTSYGNNINIASNTNGLPSPQMYFYPPVRSAPFKQTPLPPPPPPPPRDPQRKLLLYNGTSEQPSAFVRSRSDHMLTKQVTPEPIQPSLSQTQFQYLADKTPRSRRPIHVVPLINQQQKHEPSPECIMPSPPPWLNVVLEPEKVYVPEKKVNKPIEERRVSSIEVHLRHPSKTPPPPPVRRYSRQSSVSSLEDEPKRHSSNLEDALNELEAIYQSLRLGDEDLLDRAERRDLPTVHQQMRTQPSNDEVTMEDVVLRRKNRAPPNRRSGIPDLVMDDMAYRRLHPAPAVATTKERQSGSYLLVSPTLSPVTVPPYDPMEPDTTLDDMSYRALRNANSLRVIEDQPPFGIPLTPAPAAPESDYLHVVPKDKYRPTFRPRKTPDVVKDDLAFRNLRKDPSKIVGDKRKRAVRSLSANLINIMELQDIEKTQSLTNLPDNLQVLLEGTELNTDAPYSYNRPPPSWIERANLLDTSTETLTESRANLRSLRNSFFEDSRPNSLFIPQRRVTPIKEDQSPTSCPFDEEKLEELLSALAKEAHDTSERLGRDLERLRDGSRSVEDLNKSPPTLTQGGDSELLVPGSRHSSALLTRGDVWRRDPAASAFKTPPGRRSPVLTEYLVPEPRKDTNMATQLRTSERAKARASNLPVATDESKGRTERIARYKEERRKQLAAQYGAATSSSSGVESPGPAGDGPRRFISRDDKGCISEPMRNIRTTRASRLRAAAAIGTTAPSPPPEVKSAPEAKPRPTRRSKAESPDPSSSSAPSSDVPSREGTPQYVSSRSSSLVPTLRGERAERDKSSKRKSNLNRNLTEEPLPPTSDSTTDDTTVTGASRRRRSARSTSMGASSAPTSTLRGVSNPPPQQQRPSPSPAPPPVFQRLQCNVRPTPAPRTSIEKRTPEPSPREKTAAKQQINNGDVSKRVDVMMARTKEFESRIDRLTSSNKKPINLASRSSPIKLLTSKDKIKIKEPTKLLVVNNDDDDDNTNLITSELENIKLTSQQNEKILNDITNDGDNVTTTKVLTSADKISSELIHEHPKLPSSSENIINQIDDLQESISEMQDNAERDSGAASLPSKESSEETTIKSNGHKAELFIDEDKLLKEKTPPTQVITQLVIKSPIRKISSQSLIKKPTVLPITSKSSVKLVATRSVTSPIKSPSLIKSPVATVKSPVKNLVSPAKTPTSPIKTPTSPAKSPIQRIPSKIEAAKKSPEKVITPEPTSSEIKEEKESPIPSQDIGEASSSKNLDDLIAALANSEIESPCLESSEINSNLSNGHQESTTTTTSSEEIKTNIEIERPSIIKSAPNSPIRTPSCQSPTKENEPKRKTSILKKKSIDETSTPISILKHKDETNSVVIMTPATTTTVVASTSSNTEMMTSSRPQSILKKRSSLEETTSQDEESSSIRRRSSREEIEDQQRSFSPEPQGILKRKSNSIGETARPILKKKSSEDLGVIDEPPPTRPILKKKASTDEEMDIEKPRPILKSGRRSVEGEEGSNYSSAAGSPARRSPCMLDEAVIRNQVALHLRFATSQEEDEEEQPPLRHGDSCSEEDEEGACSLPPLPCEGEDDEEERRPSVSERAQLFMRLSEMHANPVPRPRDTARRERAKRFSTQPVTSEEVDEARGQLQSQASTSSAGDQHGAGSLSSLQATIAEGGTADEDEEEPSQLSLAERVRLFNEKIRLQQAGSATPPLQAGPKRRSVRRTVTSTRFRTLPVTEAEVEQVSPLAASFTKPPDPGVLGGMSARAAREAMFEHATKVLAKPATAPSPAGDDQVPDSRPKGILKHSSSVPPASKPPPPLAIVSQQPMSLPIEEAEESEIVRGILKIPASAIAQARLLTSSSSNVKSAMKKESSFDDSAPRGILKPQSMEWSETSSSEDDVTGVTNDLASILNTVSSEAQVHAEYTVETRPTVEHVHSSAAASSSDECDTSSSGGREVKNIIGCVAAEPRGIAVALPPPVKQVVKEQPVTNVRHIPVTSSEPVTCAGDYKDRTPESSPVKESSFKGSPVKPRSPNLEDLSPGPQRSKTQSSIADKNSMSIAERLAALKQSGETEWKKRVARSSPERQICTNGGGADTKLKPLQTSASMPGSTGGILAEKLSLLDQAAQDWKKRVGPNDAIEFSVAGRMGIQNTTPLASPVHTPVDRKKKTPKPARFKSKAGRNENKSTPSSPQKDLAPHALTRSISAPEARPGDTQTVEVPAADNETFAAFFSNNLQPSTSPLSSLDPVPTEQLSDFEELSQHTLLVSHKRTVKMQRRRLGSRNPVKALAARTDLVQEYQEVRTGAAEREMKRLNVEKLAKHSNLAVEALAGLASKEDFTAVALRKATAGPVGSLLPYSDLMLLQVKGRRHVQTRLVEPLAESINEGDSYILVTPTTVYNWLGRLSNVIERTRSAEVALQVSQRKDLGCSKAAGVVITIDESKALCSGIQRRAFWRLLGVEDGDGKAKAAGHPDEDESYEASVTDTNMVYCVEGDELVPLEKFWGGLPRIEMLDPSKVLVFDFGSELYIWSGKNAASDARRAGLSLAQELWEAGFDYSECDISPLGTEVCGQRPAWALLGKLNQHMETSLFREKFLDWPEFSRVIRVKEKEGDDKQVDGSIEVLPCDVAELLACDWSEPDLELEGSHLGRGDSFFDPETHRQFEVATSGVTVWHIEEFGYHELPPESAGQFHSDDSYVVRWSYSITVTGRELSGAPSKHAMTGRSRCAYFFWQGSRASLNEQGAAALLTVELDREQGPQVRVVQGVEPAAFLRLFNGAMAVHAGHREQQEDEEEEEVAGPWRLYLARTSAHASEVCLVQVPCSVRQLRSRTSLVLLNTHTGAALVWHGSQAHPATRRAIMEAVEVMKTARPLEFCLEPGVNLRVKEIKEGAETEEFFTGLGGSSRQLYVSLPPTKSLPPLRLFHLSSASGSFVTTEILSPARSKDPPQAFPFLQLELYDASQPALFLLDAGPELWLWQGWWAEDGGEEAAGSGAVRWQAERRAAMQTALDYWQHTRKNEAVRASLVWAGLEPLEFTNLFPHWLDRDDAAECNIQDGHKPGEVLSVQDELARLTRSTYPPAQLLQRPLPDGVDPTRLEDYLAPQHFEELLGMSKEEFLELPSWKQTNVKKEIGLF